LLAAVCSLATSINISKNKSEIYQLKFRVEILHTSHFSMGNRARQASRKQDPPTLDAFMRMNEDAQTTKPRKKQKNKRNNKLTKDSDELNSSTDGIIILIIDIEMDQYANGNDITLDDESDVDADVLHDEFEHLDAEEETNLFSDSDSDEDMASETEFEKQAAETAVLIDSQ
jgi:hypothetical protein